ncbi:Positive regulator of purine utilization [Aspergillus nidulans FGSC A4] [Rhizoctonia solani]|uniref:Positive regulator of purine utilization [Aspergillus nidulans FGSC A4] n=1 Tax=Rhizoctonia solani TaxID=456999 RepID=A0A0K6FYR0_9AGAM|nr:Positive regulator of purine utilization [Aspergillus nidulans FGSC A4] [Rhizoctonia solani]
MSVLRQDSSRSNSVASDEQVPTSPVKPTTLRKNQACHQCRKQKRKCDARRPCKSCVRAHANVIANAVKRGKPFPARPDCVYDGDSPAIYDAAETVDLNERNELASKILLASSVASPPPNLAQDKSLQSPPSMPDLSSSLFTQINQLNQTTQPTPISLMDSLWSTSPSFDLPFEDIGGYGFVQPRSGSSVAPEMLLDLPPLDLVCNLVDVCFENWPFAREMIHMPTFKQRARLPPSDPNFPSIALLHALCALGAVYLPQPGAPSEEIRPGEPVRGNMFRTDEQVSKVLEGMASFGEHQAMVAQIKALNDARTGKRLLESLQTLICVCWWYMIHTRWADLWIISGNAMRLSIPLGLCGARGYDEILWGPNFGDTSFQNFKENILPATTDFVELETRKRTFWMAFVTDRTHSSATAWPAALDELDIGQSFPYPLEIFEAGLPPTTKEPPQKLCTPDMLTSHHPGLTDDGILFLKSIEILSRVTVFNNRVRTRYADATNVPAAPAFKVLDETITTYLQSIPPEYENVVTVEGVRTLRAPALAMPHVARILLHDPHCKLDDPNDFSTRQCLLASRAILNMTYQLQGTSVQFKLLPPTFVFLWAISGKSLLRSYAHSLKIADYANALIFREEVRFLSHSAIRLGESLAIGLRHGLVLQDLMDRVDKLHPLPEGCVWPSPTV